MGKLLLSTAIGLTMAVALGGAGNAATHQTTAGVRPQHQLPLPAGEHKIKATVLNSGYYGASASGFTTLSSSTATCSSTSTCTLAMSAMVQRCFGTAGNYYADVTLVDGTYVDGGPFAGYTSGGCQTSSWQGNYAVAPGAHTVVYQTYGSLQDIAQWSNRTDITKP